MIEWTHLSSPFSGTLGNPSGMRLQYLPANQAYVFTFGDSIVPMDDQALFQQRREAVAAAKRRGLVVDRRGRVTAEKREFGGPDVPFVPLGPHGSLVRNATLITSTDTPKSERLIRSVARAKFGRGKVYDAFYEHGQWWVAVGERGDTIWSAVDARPGFDGRGVDFERLG